MSERVAEIGKRDRGKLEKVTSEIIKLKGKRERRPKIIVVW